MAEEMDEDRDVAMAAAAAVASAEALRRARAAWTKEQEEYVRSFLATEKLLGFTMTLEEKDLFLGYLDEQKKETTTTNTATPSEDGGTVMDMDVEDNDEEKATLERDSSERSLDSDTAQQVMLLGDDKQKDEEAPSQVAYIVLPSPGVSKADATGNEAGRRHRKVVNGCAVCLGEFEAQDSVCWSSNEGCPHVFHEECIMDWIVAMARRRRRARALEGNDDADADDDDDDEEVGGVSKGLVKFPMLCPCCRQEFFASPTKL